MNLPEYIESIGDAKASELFGVAVRTAMSWRLKDRRPRPEKAREIAAATQGQVTLDEIYAIEDATQ